MFNHYSSSIQLPFASACMYYILSFKHGFMHAPQSPFLHIDLTKSERR